MAVLRGQNISDFCPLTLFPMEQFRCGLGVYLTNRIFFQVTRWSSLFAFLQIDSNIFLTCRIYGGISLILSVSRRTDIPAFYSDWFFNRLKEGYVLVRNPMNYQQVSKIILTPSLIDCIVFWTKDPTNMLVKLDFLTNYKYYFQITINAYDKIIERNVPSIDEVIEAFKGLSLKIGKEKVIWRYDPIIFTNEMDIEYHCKYFDLIASQLEGSTKRCIISFVDLYKKSERNLKNINTVSFDNKKMLEAAKRLSEIAFKHNIKIETCSELIDLSIVGIEPAKCIDDLLISKIIGQSLRINKDKNQRDVCGCVKSIDIGAYNTCKHGCLYCYANYSDIAVENNILKHDPRSPMLIGNIEPDDKITERKMESYRDNQLSN